MIMCPPSPFPPPLPDAQFPWMILLGCIAHALSLLMKDLCKEKSKTKPMLSPWTAKVYAATLVISNTMANNELVRALVHKHMKEVYEGRIKGISSNCDTR